MNQMQHDFASGPVAKTDYGPLLGAPYKVFLAGGVTERIDETGHTVTEIKDLPGLFTAVVQARVTHPRKLAPADLKFIRSALCFRSNEIASRLDMTPEYYSRCENGARAMSFDKEKNYRMFTYLSAFAKDKKVCSFKAKIESGETRLPEVTPDEAEKAMTAFTKIFLDMKIVSVFSVDDNLEFDFCRKKIKSKPNNTRPDKSDCDNNDGSWESKEGKVA